MCSAVCQRCAFSADGKPPVTFFVVRDQGAVVAMSGMTDAPVDRMIAVVVSPGLVASKDR